MSSNYHYRSSMPFSYNGTQNIGAMNLDSNIVPNMTERCIKLKRRMVFLGLCIPICMVLFMGGAILSGVTGNFAFIAFTPIGFFGFAATGVFLGLTGQKMSGAKFVVETIDEIYAKDCTYIKDLFLAQHIGVNKTLIIVKKLIQTKNIDFYEVVGDVAVAKTELRLKAKDLIKNTASEVPTNINIITDKPTKCPSCGSAITDNSKFCSYCGSRL